MNSAQFSAQLLSQAPIQRAKRFIEQEYRGFEHGCAGKCDSLLLATAELTWIPRLQPQQLHLRERRPNSGAYLRPPGMTKPEWIRDVLENGQMWKQSVVLKHEPDSTVSCRRRRNIAGADPNRASGRPGQAADDS
jgi:hypothetical protein